MWSNYDKMSFLFIDDRMSNRLNKSLPYEVSMAHNNDSFHAWFFFSFIKTIGKIDMIIYQQMFMILSNVFLIIA